MFLDCIYLTVIIFCLNSFNKAYNILFFSEASSFLNQALGSVNEVVREDLIDRMLEIIQKQNCKF